MRRKWEGFVYTDSDFGQLTKSHKLADGIKIIWRKIKFSAKLTMDKSLNWTMQRGPAKAGPLKAGPSISAGKTVRTMIQATAMEKWAEDQLGEDYAIIRLEKRAEGTEELYAEEKALLVKAEGSPDP